MHHFTIDEARRLGDIVGARWNKYDVDQFRLGLEIELEHGLAHSETNVTQDDPIATAKIALAHLNQIPDYYSRLRNMLAEAERFYQAQENGYRQTRKPVDHSIMHECWIESRGQSR